jgi:hypothetical protein
VERLERVGGRLEALEQALVARALGPCRHDDADVARIRLRDQAQQDLEGCRVAPVRVLHHEDVGPVSGHPFEEVDEGLGRSVVQGLW